MAAPKKYGLIIPKSKQPAVKKPTLGSKSVFGNRDSSDEEDASTIKAAINKSLFQESDKKARNRAAQVTMARALEEDPTVYQYDEVYEKMNNDKHSVVEKKKTKDRKPKYVHQLLKNAAARKLDDERRMERQAHREREQEGDEFGEKEAYITPSFLKKQAELKAAEEAARRKEADEAANDVTQKDNLTDFYRNLLSRKTSAGSQWSSLPPDQAKVAATAESTAATSAQTTASGQSTASSGGRDQKATSGETAGAKEEEEVVSDPDDPSDAESEASSSSAESEEVEAAMEAAKTDADREAEDLLARRRALDALKEKRKAEEEAKPAEDKLSRRNDDTSVSSARERYMQRKREQAEKAAAGQ